MAWWGYFCREYHTTERVLPKHLTHRRRRFFRCLETTICTMWRKIQWSRDIRCIHSRSTTRSDRCGTLPLDVPSCRARPSHRAERSLVPFCLPFRSAGSPAFLSGGRVSLEQNVHGLDETEAPFRRTKVPTITLRDTSADPRQKRAPTQTRFCTASHHTYVRDPRCR